MSHCPVTSAECACCLRVSTSLEGRCNAKADEERATLAPSASANHRRYKANFMPKIITFAIDAPSRNTAQNTADFRFSLDSHGAANYKQPLPTMNFRSCVAGQKSEAS